jgi:hypothetical protein
MCRTRILAPESSVVLVPPIRSGEASTRRCCCGAIGPGRVISYRKWTVKAKGQSRRGQEQDASSRPEARQRTRFAETARAQTVAL